MAASEVKRIMELSDLFGPSGFEDRVASYVRSHLDYETTEDHMRNVRCVKEGNGPRIMLDAHMDEVGLIVQAIKPNGTMRILPLGGMNPQSLGAHNFRILAENGSFIKAVIASKPPHFMSASDKNRAVTMDELILDAGTSSKDETEALGIHIGSPAVPDTTCTYDEERGIFFGKAFDDRIGVAAMMEVMNRIMDKELPCSACASFSVQEEVGERGVMANARALQPEALICFEGCPADDTFSEPYMVQAAMGKGVMLRHMDISMITNHRFQKFALDTAREHGIPVQESVRKGGGTNAAKIYEELGVPGIVIGVPVRYIHHCSCIMDYRDYKAAVDLGIALLEKLDRTTVNQF